MNKLPSNILCFILGLANDYIGYTGLHFYQNQKDIVFFIKKLLDFEGYKYEIKTDNWIYIHCEQLDKELMPYLSDFPNDELMKGYKKIIFSKFTKSDKYFYFIGCLFVSDSRNTKKITFANSVNKTEFLNNYLREEGINYRNGITDSIPMIHHFDIFY